MATLVNKPSLVEYKKLKFLIMDSPKDSNLHLYIKECKRHNVKYIARISPPSYSVEEVNAAGITLQELYFEDGASPPDEIITRWLDLVSTAFSSTGDSPCVAVHCVAGLGRAPVLVAIALIELGDMDPISAVTMIRERRRGAINAVQLNYLESYRKRLKKGGAGSTGKCTIM